MSSPGSRRWRSGWIRAVSAGIAPAVAVSGVLIAGATPYAVAAPEVPDVTQLAGSLANQEIAWEDCDFGDSEANAQLIQPNLQCATVKVPQDWKNPDSTTTFDIRISQVKNIEVDNPRYKGTIFGNPGGPGGPGLAMGPILQLTTPDLNPYYNYVGFDPRGVGESSGGQSTDVTCEYTWTPDPKDPAAEFKALGQQCSTDPQVRVINTEQTAYDMDFVRSLLGAPKLDYIGYSYGTWLGSWYSKVFGAKYGGKFVLDSAIDATQPTLEETWNLQPKSRDRQFEMHMMNWIARNDATYGLGTDARAIYDRYFAATQQLEDPVIAMLVWLFGGGYQGFFLNELYPIAGETVKLLIDIGEGRIDPEDLDENPAVTLDRALAKLAATERADRDAIADLRATLAPFVKLRPSTTANGEEQTSQLMMGVFSMVTCNDGQYTQGAQYWNARNAGDAKKYPLSAQWGVFDQISDCAYWRTGNLMPVADKTSYPKTVLVQSEMDSQTAWEGGYQAGVKLPNTSFIAVDNEGTHGIFPYGTEAVDRPIINFFLGGKRPKDITVTQAKPLPGDTQTFETWGKLNERAKHEPVNPGPWTPTEDPGPMTKQKMSAAAQAAVTSVRAAAGPDAAAMRQQIVKIYGPQGLAAMKEAGIK